MLGETPRRMTQVSSGWTPVGFCLPGVIVQREFNILRTGCNKFNNSGTTLHYTVNPINGYHRSEPRWTVPCLSDRMGNTLFGSRK